MEYFKIRVMVVFLFKYFIIRICSLALTENEIISVICKIDSELIQVYQLPKHSILSLSVLSGEVWKLFLIGI